MSPRKRWAVLGAAYLSVSGCRRGSELAVPPAVTLGPENLAAAIATTLQAGPAITGILKPRQIATARAEVAGPVRQVLVERGERVDPLRVLVVLDETGLRDQLLAARSALRAASNTLAVARQEEARSRRLAEAGGLAQRDLERAVATVQAQKAQAADAQARLSVAEQQMGRTRVRAPFEGIVSDRPVNEGDVAQVGSPLFTVVDPSTMRLEATVPAERLDRLGVGTVVDFRVTGYGDRLFRGHVERLLPNVDPATGQVRLDVEIPNAGGTLLGGLSAQGRVVLDSARGLSAPLDAVDFGTVPPSVLRVRAGHVERVEVALGVRDEVTQRVQIVRGISEGDLLVRTSARDAVSAGSKVQISGPPEERPARAPHRP